jgi:hypothetical protein
VPFPRERPPGNARGASSCRPPVAPLARGAGGVPNAPRPSAAAVRRQAARGTARSGQVAQVQGGWRCRGFVASGPREGPAGKAGGTIANGISQGRRSELPCRSAYVAYWVPLAWAKTFCEHALARPAPLTRQTVPGWWRASDWLCTVKVCTIPRDLEQV